MGKTLTTRPPPAAAAADTEALRRRLEELHRCNRELRQDAEQLIARARALRHAGSGQDQVHYHPNSAEGTHKGHGR